MFDESARPGEVDPPSSAVEYEARTVSRVFPRPEVQVGRAVSALIQASNHRTTINGRITSRLNAERPYRHEDLVRAGMGWRSNITSRPLATLLQRAFGRFPRAIAEARTLTTARLPRATPNGGAKSEAYQHAATNFIRSDARWKPLIDAISWEDVAFGYTAAVWRDEYDWMPVALRQDSFFVPVGTRQHAISCPYFAFRHDMLPHEAFDLLLVVERTIADSAADGGRRPLYTWHPERLAEAISNAVREDSAEASTATQDGARRVEDLRRQLSEIGATGAGRKIVQLYHVYAVELTGAVSHFIVDRDFKLLFEHLDRFPSLPRSATFFSFEAGDGTLHGSKGIGRLAYNMAAVIDRTVNDVFDRFHLSGKLFIKSPMARHRTFQMTMRGGFCLIDPDFELLPTVKVESGVADSLSLTTFATAQLDAIAGTVSPHQIEGERVTAAAVNLLASRESDRTDDYLGRFLPQIGEMVTEILRRACSPNAPRTPETDKLAADLLAAGLTDDEVEYLSNQPAMPTLSGWTASERAARILACVEGRGNPVYDQRRIEQAKLEAQVDADFAESVLAPTPDPTQLAEQERQQSLENLVLLNGQAVPVSPRDNHVVHLTGLVPMIQSSIQEAAQNPSADSILTAFVAHAEAHVQAGGRDPAIAPFVEMVTQMKRTLAQLQEAAAAEANAAQANAAAAADPNSGVSEVPAPLTPHVKAPVHPLELPREEPAPPA